jgi:hypothetical protein
MSRRLMEQRAAIDRIAFEKKNWDLTLQTGEWNLLEQLIKLLSEVELVSNLFCKSPLSTQIPYSSGLVKTLQNLNLEVPFELPDEFGQTSIKEIEDVRENLVKEINTRFSIAEKKKY